MVLDQKRIGGRGMQGCQKVVIIDAIVVIVIEIKELVVKKKEVAKEVIVDVDKAP